MPVMEYLERNAHLYGDEVALVELNPEEEDTRRVSWKEYDLVMPSRFKPYRREITWKVFDEKANRVANMLISRGIKKGDKVAIILYNCLEWLPIYFGILKSGAIAVPFNFRYDAEEILYCAELAEVDIIIFGSEFIGRIEQNAERLGSKPLFFLLKTVLTSFLCFSLSPFPSSTSFLSFSNLFFILCWSMVDLQYCVSFRCTAK